MTADISQDVIDFLNRPIRTLKAIRELQARIRGLEDAMLPRGVRYDKDRVQGTRTDPMLIFAERVDALQDKVDDLKLVYLSEVKEVEDAIAQLENQNERCVLTMRYVHRMRYEDIADAMFYSPRTIYSLHRSGAARIKIPKDCSVLQ